MSDNFISDYLFYTSGTESPREFHLWSALTLLSTVLGNRCRMNLGVGDGYSHLWIYPNLMTALVGPMGMRKSSATNPVLDILTEFFPDKAVTPNCDTREAITKWWASEKAEASYYTPDGLKISYKPLFFHIHEIEQFISVNPEGMISFLTDASDKYAAYKVRTKNQGEDYILKPYATMLACATTDYIGKMMKKGLLSGGIARRILWVVKDNFKRKANPNVPPGGIEARMRFIKHLQLVTEKVYGDFTWDSLKSQTYYDDWYESISVPQDPLMQGFYTSKADLIRRVAMLLVIAEYDIVERGLKLTKDHFDAARIMVEMCEPGMQQLFLSGGRNELIGPMHRLIEILKSHGGGWSAKQTYIQIQNELDPSEQEKVFFYMKNKTGVLCKNTLKVERLNNQGLWVAREELWIEEELERQVDAGRMKRNGDDTYRFFEK